MISRISHSDAEAVCSTFRFHGFVLDLGLGELRCGDRVLALSNKSLDVLVHLIRNRDRLVSREELLAAVWPGVSVANGSVSQAIWEIRRALADTLASGRMIKTRRGRGYRFVAELGDARVAREPARGDERYDAAGSASN